jgi:hypothetical protein
VSVTGGNNPQWAHNGRELFFRNGSQVFESVRFRAGSDFEVVERTELFNAQQYQGRLQPDPGDSLFVGLVQGGARSDARYIVVRNWIRELLARAEEARR